MASAADTALNTNKQSRKVSGITDKKVFLLLSLTPVMLHQNFNASAWNHVNADVSSDTAIKKMEGVECSYSIQMDSAP